MGADMIAIITTLFSGWYDLLTSVKFPGTNFSIFSLLMITLFVSICISLVLSLIGYGGLVMSRGEQKGGNNKRLSLPEARKEDTK